MRGTSRSKRSKAEVLAAGEDFWPEIAMDRHSFKREVDLIVSRSRK